MLKAQSLMVQGTTSDAGKSVLTTALCRIFARKGYLTAPFKSQNMALNSYITADGKEIGRAQGVQAEAAGTIATTDMNPILIKPSGDLKAQIVVHGKPLQTMGAGAYRSEFYHTAKQIIQDSYIRLTQEYERIIIEGAGSPAEINLNDRELVNMHVARMANAPVILVADIDRGGVFASLVGTLHLLEPDDRERVIGVVINKFRGDLSLLQPGLTWFEEYTGKPVLGVIPYIENLLIDAEDSLALRKYHDNQMQSNKRDRNENGIDIAVIQLARISNFTDLDPFYLEEDCSVRFVSRAEELGNPDLVIIPGSKNTIEDLQLLQQSGLDQALKALIQLKLTWIFGICGGYQMLGERITDPYQVESQHTECTGLGLLPIATEMTRTKKTTHSSGQALLFGQKTSVTGYEIHMGHSTPLAPVPYLIALERDGESHGQDGAKSSDEQVIGTYFHGIFHNDNFRSCLLNRIRERKGLAPIKNRSSFQELREASFDELANVVQKHIRLDLIEEKMRS